ncbi:MAG: riboflavin synthase [Gammaproteobacteria bacterium]|nr:MAG: riboflavin synthase [Gammaproteobacteria bacterium]
MFTGIIQDVGTIKAVQTSGTDTTVTVEAPHLGLADAHIGDSIAVNGVCLTATTIDGNTYTADISHETLSKTTLKDITVGWRVNLEKALTLSTPLGGHLVSGHVDGVGQLIKKVADGNSTRYFFSAPSELLAFIAPKGSITIQGISLTVNGVSDSGFDVAIIPHTEEKTNLGDLAIGAGVNLEIDLIARYVARLLQSGADVSTLTMDKIRAAGF